MATIDPTTLPTYDASQTYLWNCEHSPKPVDVDVPSVPGDWTFCGKPVPSPLGVPAGPLLNGRWILYYASLGFDVLTYKTVRSSPRECYPLPNLVPVVTGPLHGGEDNLATSNDMQGSWAVSFGMPSAHPDVWRADIEQTRSQLAPEKILSVSVVGTVKPGWSIEDLAADYARCAEWAVESGADTIETNFSCPNVSTCDGQLFQQPEDSAVVASAVREAIGDRPLILKIGHMVDRAAATELLDAVAPFANALAMTNSVATTIRDSEGELLFDGQRRGICGSATFEASLTETKLFIELIRERGDELSVISVGGISTAEQVQACLGAGAEAVHIASAAMVQPDIALGIRRNLTE